MLIMSVKMCKWLPLGLHLCAALAVLAAQSIDPSPVVQDSAVSPSIGDTLEDVEPSANSSLVSNTADGLATDSTHLAISPVVQDSHSTLQPSMGPIEGESAKPGGPSVLPSGQLQGLSTALSEESVPTSSQGDLETFGYSTSLNTASAFDDFSNSILSSNASLVPDEVSASTMGQNSTTTILPPMPSPSVDFEISNMPNSSFTISPGTSDFSDASSVIESSSTMDSDMPDRSSSLGGKDFLTTTAVSFVKETEAPTQASVVTSATVETPTVAHTSIVNVTQKGEPDDDSSSGLSSGGRAAIGIVVTICILALLVMGIILYKRFTHRSFKSFITSSVKYKTYNNASYKDDEGSLIMPER